MKIGATEPLTECNAKGALATAWYVDHWANANCAGTVERTRTYLQPSTCVTFDAFSVHFETTLGAVEACEMAGIQASLFGQDVVLNEYGTGNCGGNVTHNEVLTVFEQSDAPAAVGAAKCANLCDGFCCRRASSSCVLEAGSYKRMMTCSLGQAVIALDEFTDNSCQTASTAFAFVAGKCNRGSDTFSRHAMITPSMDVLVNSVCDYTPAEGIVFAAETSEVLAVVNSTVFVTEIAGGSAILSTVSPAGTPALSLLVAIAAVSALLL
eukprot:gene10118-15553_t